MSKNKKKWNLKGDGTLLINLVFIKRKITCLCLPALGNYKQEFVLSYLPALHVMVVIGLTVSQLLGKKYSLAIYIYIDYIVS
jgi:hypothetical protein